MLVVIVGSRFGSSARPSAASALDFDGLAAASGDISFVCKKAAGTYSVTQLEVLSAISAGIPVFAFVDHRVMTEHDTYEANKDSEFIAEMKFGSIDDADTARHIFEFIGFLRSRIANNALFTFANVGEIEGHLRKQWSSLFQRLMAEQRAMKAELQQIDRLSEQFDNLQTAILASIGSDLSKEVARGVVNFRYLIDVLAALGIQGLRPLVVQGASWEDLIAASGIVQVDEVRDSDAVRGPWRMLVRFADGTIKGGRISSERWSRLESEWGRFVDLPEQARLNVFDALSENSQLSGLQMFRTIDFADLQPESPHLGLPPDGYRVKNHTADGKVVFERTDGGSSVVRHPAES